ncbi:glycoside hydrolase family 16 protein [Babjeviella inositovora NRRL Y-12698]|uniref:Crh-like protein n=1 Tax=Babjeviella inositovora NRRL Y-12698 TaxID=984486 RepID=A0A1E3QQR9_9ASCO|nr:glycoside hydrolase family 16 protein [Babjeviella inositovora NRRL Y-12698]ODQ79978.1 glycoside hydrolase family 16 protein [Babjeviella inositovora NRRL Y-12698]
MLAFASYVNAAASAIICNGTQSCPESLPCCSQYGECGVGAYCLGGCDPRFSFSIGACMAMPVCKNITTQFNNKSALANMDTYLGNASEADWVYLGYLVDYEDEDALIMAMPANTAGTVISSTHYMWYGKVSATVKSSHLQGVVTAFILFSNAKDEFDYEFVGADLEKVQTNYYYQGVLNFTNSQNVTVDDTFDNYHTYEFEWTESQMSWSVDGVVSRTLKKSDTWNVVNKTYFYPQTPARVQFSLWPGGAASNPIGTVDWAGGEINWNAPDLTNPGYYYAILKNASIQCYPPPPNIKTTGNTAYIFNSTAATENSIEITNNRTDLGSLDKTGLDPGEPADENSSSSSGTNSGSSTSTATANVIPVGIGVGNVQGEGNTAANSANTANNAATTTAAAVTGFVQSTKKTSSSSNAAHGLRGDVSSLKQWISAGFLFALSLMLI